MPLAVISAAVKGVYKLPLYRGTFGRSGIFLVGGGLSDRWYRYSLGEILSHQCWGDPGGGGMGVVGEEGFVGWWVGGWLGGMGEGGRFGSNLHGQRGRAQMFGGIFVRERG